MTFFDIQEFGGQYRIVMYKEAFKYSFVTNIIKYLNITINQFNKAIKKYNGFCVKWIRFDEEYSCMHFKDKKDAEKFIIDYLEPILVTNLINKQEGIM